MTGGRAAPAAVQESTGRFAARAGGRHTVLGDLSARQVLAPLGLPFIGISTVTTEDEATRAAARYGRPVAIKLLSDVLVHKTEAGLVRLGVAPADAAATYRDLWKTGADLGVDDAVVVVQPMAPDGVDLFVGCDRDPTFGPLLLVGLGGTTVELFRDVARWAGRVTPVEVERMMRSLAAYPLLNGFRGGPRYDLSRFAEIVSTVADFAVETPLLQELDLNPVRILPNGECVILDARASSTGEAATTGQRLGSRRPVAPPGAPPRDLDPLFSPRSVAVIGASRDASRPGGRVIRYLREHHYGGTVYPVNPAVRDIAGIRAWPTLASLPETPDLVCVALPADSAITAVAECAAQGVPAVILFASGFGESGAAGAPRDERLREALAGSGTVLCGPNTIGVVSPDNALVATFSQGLDGVRLTSSGVGVISQSGAVAGSLISRELARGYGIGDWVTVGNQMDLDVADYIEYLATRSGSKAIALFLEGVTDGTRFRTALRTAAEAGVPVVAYKTGLTEVGSRAVTAHSGALAGSAEAYRAVLAQEGVVQVEEMTALLEVSWLLATAPPPVGDRIAVVSTSGGAGSAAADLIDQHGLTLATFSNGVTTELGAVLPDFAQVSNPLDITAQGAFAPGVLRETLRLLGEDPGVDAICVVLTSIAGGEAVRVASEIRDATAATGKAVVVTWLIDPSLADKGLGVLAAGRVRTFDEPARMVSALAHLVRRGRHSTCAGPERETPG
ncbi:acetate--CoA ligase family protein [Streptomyces sp. NPDC057137]|uniref:acetate--CoA ligase family protein n=1 Tax=Streptomyces sp. NPDC057137 TaxID=3346030 RepID=UPI0036368615